MKKRMLCGVSKIHKENGDLSKKRSVAQDPKVELTLHERLVQLILTDSSDFKLYIVCHFLSMNVNLVSELCSVLKRIRLGY